MKGNTEKKAAALMRESLLLGLMLSNAECWINQTKTDLEKLEIPDKSSERHVLGAHGNPSKAFMHLKLGFLPVKVVIINKRL